MLRETKPVYTAFPYRRVEEDVVLEIRLVRDGLEVRRRLLAKVSHLERQVARDVGVSRVGGPVRTIITDTLGMMQPRYQQ